MTFDDDDDRSNFCHSYGYSHRSRAVRGVECRMTLRVIEGLDKLSRRQNPAYGLLLRAHTFRVCSVFIFEIQGTLRFLLPLFFSKITLRKDKKPA